ncbi:hypothetical protein BON22_5228 [Cyberlindnera fabianii]|uniref:Uncharacterized protein n=1 Tax=Cyberlindnera fabianii TaxID=36022 RepID=A0A1V2KZ54_CYBFA|nr:hypothetical protein BON22_5228 [Cyberlindnera fabianii]
MSGKVFFITGANRGIGLELTKAFAADPANTIIASARDPSKATALQSLSNVKIVKLDISDESSINELPAQLEKVAPEGIDYYIANAGVAGDDAVKKALVVEKSVWVDHYITNALGPILVTQKVYPFLLKKSTRVISLTSSIAGSIGGFFETSTSGYGQSKAALNHFAKLLSYELRDEGFTVIAVHPGVVSSDMGKAALANLPEESLEAVKALLITPEESGAALHKLILGLTKEQNGTFLNYTGEELPW